MKDKSFKQRFVALTLQTTAILQGKTDHNFARKDAFAHAKAMVINMKTAPRVFEMNLEDLYFQKIGKGEKTIELRLYDERRRPIKPGDEIVFINRKTKEVLRVSVNKLHVFPTFKELYAVLPLRACGYSEKELQHASYRDMDIFYTPELQEKWGVVGIELSILPS